VRQQQLLHLQQRQAEDTLLQELKIHFSLAAAALCINCPDKCERAGQTSRPDEVELGSG